MARRLKHWGWGYEDEQPSTQELYDTARFLVEHFGFGSLEPEQPAPLPELPAPRLKPPQSLEAICHTDDYERALHSWGRSYSDIVRAFRGSFEHPPDVVAYPRDEGEAQAVLDWALSSGAAVIPFGGGTSVVGGVEPRGSEDYAGVVTIDLKRLERVLEVDPVSMSARIQAGAPGPRLEEQLGEHGLTLRHFPQSFQFSTLGGWIATRAGGHFATLYTHIDDLVESVRALTPRGVWESRRLPGSGAGVSPDRMLLGSEGTLGLISEAWVQVRPRPTRRASVGVRFADFSSGAAAVRELSQAGLYPTNCRLIDADEARITGAGDGSYALLVLGFEAAEHDVEPAMSIALDICTELGGTWERPGSEGSSSSGGEGVGSWREAFLRAPYLRDTFIALGILSETFETAITWDRFATFNETVMERARRAVLEVCGAGSVTCRFTHVYPDGPAPYYTILAPARRGDEVRQWREIKQACSEAVISCGGTITHHHAIGRDHRPWYDQQRPEPFAHALRGAKLALDPTGALNPGVLVD
ncbi:MAG: FAD-binding oxidoreductase [Solirubrobacterales bacterium]|nr:FAD-binding oxidoreductase [Solirubrobacterales bacterium]